jgi:hypothetical protein
MFLVMRSFYNDVNASEERDLPLDAPEVDVNLRDSIPLGTSRPVISQHHLTLWRLWFRAGTGHNRLQCRL